MDDYTEELAQQDVEQALSAPQPATHYGEDYEPLSC